MTKKRIYINIDVENWKHQIGESNISMKKEEEPFFGSFL